MSKSLSAPNGIKKHECIACVMNVIVSATVYSILLSRSTEVLQSFDHDVK